MIPGRSFLYDVASPATAVMIIVSLCEQHMLSGEITDDVPLTQQLREAPLDNFIFRCCVFNKSVNARISI